MKFSLDDEKMRLEGIRRKDGSTKRAPTRKQLASGRNVDIAVKSICYVCRKYLTPRSDPVYC